MLTFLRIGRPRERLLERGLDALIFIRRSGDQPLGKPRRLVMHERIVHQEQRLRGHRRRIPMGRADVRVGAVEQRQKGMPPEPLRHQIDAATVGFVDGGEGSMLRKPPRLDGRKGMRPAERAIEIAAQQ